MHAVRPGVPAEATVGENAEATPVRWAIMGNHNEIVIAD